eukprot:COSAG01_NODE_28377_length_662_cov_1.390764_1_plen_93_part_00
MRRRGRAPPVRQPVVWAHGATMRGVQGGGTDPTPRPPQGEGLREIKALASGQLLFKVRVRGRPPDTTEPGHTAFSHQAINPIDKALLLREAL